MQDLEDLTSLPEGRYQPVFDRELASSDNYADNFNVMCCSKIYQTVVAVVWLMASVQLLVACEVVYQPKAATSMMALLFGAKTAAICGALVSLVQLAFRKATAAHTGAPSELCVCWSFVAMVVSGLAVVLHPA
jgi:hypothetical protein